MIAWAMTLGAVIFISVFFKLVKYRDSIERNAPFAYDSLGSNYMTVSQYLSGGSRKWHNYFLFRVLPYVITLALLAGFLQRYLSLNDPSFYIFSAALISVAFRDIPAFMKTHLISEKLLHVTNILLICVTSLIMTVMSERMNFAAIVPSIEGLVDNLWSSLITAAIVVIYLQATNMRARHEDEVAKDNALGNYVVQSYGRIERAYSDVIAKACAKYGCSLSLMYAILIYENMNRPVFLRLAENSIVRVFRLELTVGIAQVRSRQPLTDEQSITRAAELLGGTSTIDLYDAATVKRALADYNSDSIYAESIETIITKLKIYAPSLFEGEE